MKKFFAMLMSLLMLVSIITVPAQAAEEEYLSIEEMKDLFEDAFGYSIEMGAWESEKEVTLVDYYTGTWRHFSAIAEDGETLVEKETYQRFLRNYEPADLEYEDYLSWEEVVEYFEEYLGYRIEIRFCNYGETGCDIAISFDHLGDQWGYWLYGVYDANGEIMVTYTVLEAFIKENPETIMVLDIANWEELLTMFNFYAERLS